jgi:hypothetical protein
MRSIAKVIAAIMARLPLIPDPAIAANVTTLRAELTIMARWADYVPPEGCIELWTKLGIALYRYMPLPTYAPWCADVAAIATGVLAV